MSFESAGEFFENLIRFCSSSLASLDYDLTEIYVDSQVKLLEKSNCVPPPDAIAIELKKIASHLPGLHKQHYLGYLNALRCGDLQSALTSLQKYFDYSIKDSDTAPIQYTALNMAALYSNLEYYELALEAIQKGMLYARDENDQECLSFLLCWFHQIIYEPSMDLAMKLRQPNEKYILDSLSQRTLSQKQFRLAALCELKKSKAALEGGESSTVVFGHIRASRDLVVKHGVKSLESSVLLMKAAANRHFGFTQKSFRCIEDLLQTCHDETPSVDLAMALAHSAYHHSEIGELESALNILKEARDKFPPYSAINASKEWINVLGMILFDASVNRGEYENAGDIVTNWIQFCSENRLMTQTAQLRKAQLMDLTGNTRGARRLLQGIATEKDPRASYQTRRVQAFMKLADMDLDSGLQSGALSAMNLLFSAIAIAERYEMNLLHKLGLLKFVTVLLHLDYPAEARLVLQGILPDILTHGTLLEQGDAQYCNALTLLSQGTLTDAHKAIEDAISCYTKMDCIDGLLQCHLLKSQLFDVEERWEERNATSRTCRELLDLQTKRRRERNLARSWHYHVLGK
jgi:tetratricopeptide (TPR) repeat protein